jgi:hypothetical protein
VAARIASPLIETHDLSGEHGGHQTLEAPDQADAEPGGSGHEREGRYRGALCY